MVTAKNPSARISLERDNICRLVLCPQLLAKVVVERLVESVRFFIDELTHFIL